MNAPLLRRARTSLALAAALALGCPLAGAAESGLHDDAPRNDQQARKQCAANVHAVLTTRDGSTVLGRVGVTHAGPDWRGGDGASLSSHAYAVLRGDASADMDGLTGPCKLEDGDVGKESRINDGSNVADLLKDIDEWLEMNRRRRVEDSEAEFSQGKQKARLEIGADQRLHVVIGDGGDKTDFGRLSPHYWALYDVDGIGRLAPAYGPRLAGLGNGLDGLPGVMTPVPEADTYLMLLAGLALLAAVARRRR